MRTASRSLARTISSTRLVSDASRVRSSSDSDVPAGSNTSRYSRADFFPRAAFLTAPRPRDCERDEVVPPGDDSRANTACRPELPARTASWDASTGRTPTVTHARATTMTLLMVSSSGRCSVARLVRRLDQDEAALHRGGQPQTSSECAQVVAILETSGHIHTSAGPRSPTRRHHPEPLVPVDDPI